jgi:hypothetical protein
MTRSLPDNVLSHDMFLLQLNIEASVRCGEETRDPALLGFFANTAAAMWSAHRIFRALVAADPAKAAELMAELEEEMGEPEDYMELAAEHAEQAGIDVSEFADEVRTSIAKATETVEAGR